MGALEETGVPATAGVPAARFELHAARSMIGRRLLLRQPLLGFEAGTPCRVQCVVDFGDGLLLWIATDDERQADVDQIDADDLGKYFVERGDAAAASVSAGGGGARHPAALDAAWRAEGTGARRDPAPARWLAAAGARLAALAAGLSKSLEAARDAERLLGMNDAELATLGLRREQLIDHLRERFCRGE